MSGRVLPVATPISRAALDAAGDALEAVSIDAPLREEEHRTLASWFELHPFARLWVRGTDRARVADDLSFLAHYPRLRRLRLEGFNDLALLGELDLGFSLVDLSLTDPRGASARSYRIAPVLGCINLRKLYVEGPLRDATRLGELTGLTSLSMRSVSLPDLSALTPLTSLRELIVKLGGIRSLGDLPDVGRLEEVELSRVRGVTEVSGLGRIPTLRRFSLESLPRVTSLPSMRHATDLREATLQHMRGIDDLAPLAEAPNLEVVAVQDMKHLEPEVLRPFVDHPRLREAYLGFGSDRKNAEAWDLLPLGPKPFNYDAATARRARRRR